MKVRVIAYDDDEQLISTLTGKVEEEDLTEFFEKGEKMCIEKYNELAECSMCGAKVQDIRDLGDRFYCSDCWEDKNFKHE